MRRLLLATKNSWNGLLAAARSEEAVRQELMAFAIAVPLAFLVGTGSWQRVALIAVEIAAIPFAALQNKDSHLLRQSVSDLGPAPNVISDGSAGYGIQAEAFVNYAVTPNIEVGKGVRYWELVTKNGTVHFGPGFANSSPLLNFDHQRFGMLLQVKGKF